jgi:hypothetical protein
MERELSIRRKSVIALRHLAHLHRLGIRERTAHRNPYTEPALPGWNGGLERQGVPAEPHAVVPWAKWNVQARQAGEHSRQAELELGTRREN